MNNSILNSHMFNIDEFNISNFCVNTVKAFNEDFNKFVLFKNYLHTFHSIEEAYEASFTEYSAFLSYSIIMDSVINDKNVLTYESYLYDVLNGYSLKNTEARAEPKHVAKVWNNIVEMFNIIISLSSSPEYKSIEVNKELVLSLKHINVDKMNANYFYKAPLVFNGELKKDILIVVPKNSNSVYSNILLPFCVKYFKSDLRNIHIIEIDLYSLSYEYSVINITKPLLQRFNFILDTMYLDFNKLNLFNCNICPLTCSKKEILFTRYEPTPFNKKRKVVKIKK